MIIMNIWFATNNIHKKNELQVCLQAVIPGILVKIPSQEGLNFNPYESGSEFYENTLIKARELYNLLGNNEPVIADDSGLCVDSLDGRPGVHSAIYGYKNDIKITSHEQNMLLLDELGDKQIRTARFVCSMVLFFGNERFFIVQETLEGEIVKKSDMKGSGGFGYDPVFYVPEYCRTLAELSVQEKNIISHRGKAGKKIAEYLLNS